MTIIHKSTSYLLCGRMSLLLCRIHVNYWTVFHYLECRSVLLQVHQNTQKHLQHQIYSLQNTASLFTKLSIHLLYATVLHWMGLMPHYLSNVLIFDSTQVTAKCSSKVAWASVTYIRDNSWWTDLLRMDSVCWKLCPQSVKLIFVLPHLQMFNAEWCINLNRYVINFSEELRTSL